MIFNFEIMLKSIFKNDLRTYNLYFAPFEIANNTVKCIKINVIISNSLPQSLTDDYNNIKFVR